jgi:hypothetical protein
MAKNGYGLEALGFRFTSDQKGATTNISFTNSNRLMVSAIEGPVRVLNKDGVVLARLTPGNAYFVEEQSDSSSARGAGQQSSPKSKRQTGKKSISPRARIWIAAGVTGTAASVGFVSSNLSR